MLRDLEDDPVHRRTPHERDEWRRGQRGRREVHCQEGAGRKVFHPTQRGLEDGELQGGPHAEVFGFGQPLGGTPNGRIGEPSQGLDPEDASIGQVDDGLERQPDADPVHQEPDTLGPHPVSGRGRVQPFQLARELLDDLKMMGDSPAVRELDHEIREA